MDRTTQPSNETRDNVASAVFLRLPSVITMTGLARSTIYRMVAERTFPSPVRLGLRAVAWRKSDLETWTSERQSAFH